jgi:hypothetical protein
LSPSTRKKAGKPDRPAASSFFMPFASPFPRRWDNTRGKEPIILMGKGEIQAFGKVFANQAVATWASRGDYAFVEDVAIFDADESLAPMKDLIRCVKTKPIFRGNPKFLRNDPKGLFAWVETKTVVWVFVSQKAKRAFLGVK